MIKKWKIKQGEEWSNLNYELHDEAAGRKYKSIVAVTYARVPG